MGLDLQTYKFGVNLLLPFKKRKPRFVPHPLPSIANSNPFSPHQKPLKPVKDQLAIDEQRFKDRYPLYESTLPVDRLRQTQFARLENSKHVYVDYMGACLYSETFVKDHIADLSNMVMGNTHSDSPSYVPRCELMYSYG